MYILLIASSPSRTYKVSHNILYVTDSPVAERSWNRPSNTTSEELGNWLSFECFSSSSYTITAKAITKDNGSPEWSLARKDGTTLASLKQTWYWRTPSFASPKMDPASGVGAELSRLWGEGKICYRPDLWTLYCGERNQQFGMSNFRRIVKLDRGSTSWFIYDEARDNFKPVSSLMQNEEFAVLKVEELENQMFQAPPSKAWE